MGVFGMGRPFASIPASAPPILFSHPQSGRIPMRPMPSHALPCFPCLPSLHDQEIDNNRTLQSASDKASMSQLEIAAKTPKLAFSRAESLRRLPSKSSSAKGIALSLKHGTLPAKASPDQNYDHSNSQSSKMGISLDSDRNGHDRARFISASRASTRCGRVLSFRGTYCKWRSSLVTLLPSAGLRRGRIASVSFFPRE
jgi:hypothetical protein